MSQSYITKNILIFFELFLLHSWTKLIANCQLIYKKCVKSGLCVYCENGKLMFYVNATEIVEINGALLIII